MSVSVLYSLNFEITELTLNHCLSTYSLVAASLYSPLSERNLEPSPSTISYNSPILYIVIEVLSS